MSASGVIPSIESSATTSSPNTSSLNTSSPTPAPSRRSNERRIGKFNWRRVPHPPHPHRGKVPSIVWAHGDSYTNNARPSQVAWICDQCDAVIARNTSGSTANIRRHLRASHHINLGGAPEEEEIQEQHIEREHRLTSVSSEQSEIC